MSVCIAPMASLKRCLIWRTKTSLTKILGWLWALQSTTLTTPPCSLPTRHTLKQIMQSSSFCEGPVPSWIRLAALLRVMGFDFQSSFNTPLTGSGWETSSWRCKWTDGVLDEDLLHQYNLVCQQWPRQLNKLQLETQEIPRAEKFRMGALLAAGSKGRLFLGGGKRDKLKQDRDVTRPIALRERERENVPV